MLVGGGSKHRRVVEVAVRKVLTVGRSHDLDFLVLPKPEKRAGTRRNRGRSVDCFRWFGSLSGLMAQRVVVVVVVEIVWQAPDRGLHPPEPTMVRIVAQAPDRGH